MNDRQMRAATESTRTGTLRAGWIIASRDLAHWRRDPWTPIFGLAFSIMLLLVFGFLFGGAIDIPGVDDSDRADYIAFLVPGMLALSMMFGVETTTAAMAADAKKGITDRFRSMPIGNVAVALGRVGADMLNSVVELSVLIVGGLLIGWTIDSDPASAALAIVLLLALRFSLLWVGIFLGLTFPSESATSAFRSWSGRSDSSRPRSSRWRPCPGGSAQWRPGIRYRPPPRPPATSSEIRRG
ncbi:ABC transporter permease [Williamsia sp. 1135]|uniref:ABC transporter permease n=1 Tax=Williamsia sp. 1135 TaxID=1889262 RepID=UPI001F0B1F50|nr:ABC transporter permease [Williamsia sp. 1135]